MRHPLKLGVGLAGRALLPGFRAVCICLCACGSACGGTLRVIWSKGVVAEITAEGAEKGGIGKRTKGMYSQRIQKAWGHTAHRGWARLLLNRARDLAIHGPAHRGANGAAMPTDEDDQDGHFFFNHPERGGYPAA